MLSLLKHEAKLFFLPVVLMFIYSSSDAQLQRSLTIDVKFRIEEGDLKDSYVVITKKDGTSQTLPASSRFKVDLDFNSTYVLSFNKPGYITKKIELNTTMDDERRSQGVHFYDFVVVLFKQYDGVNIVVFNQPVAKIQYSKKIDDFDYDTDYTKSIRSALDDVEEQLKKKQEEEKKNPKPPAKDSTLAKVNKPAVEEKKEEPLARNKKPAEDPKKEMEKQKAEETPPVNDNDKGSKVAGGKDDKKKLAGIGGEDERKEPDPQGGQDENKNMTAEAGSDKKPDLAAGAGNNDKPAVKADAGKDPSVNNKGRTGDDGKTTEAGNHKEKDSESKLNMEKGEDKANPVADRSGGKDKPVITSKPQSGSDEFKETKTEAAKAKDEPVFTPPPTVDVKIDREEINEDRRSILNVWVTKGNKTIMYTRIKYSWGGVFYFKDTKTSISEHYFTQAIAGH